MESTTAASYLALVEELAPTLTGSNAKESLARLEASYDDLGAALAWFVEQGQSNEALRLANGLYRLWLTSSRFDDGARWFDRVLELDAPNDAFRGQAFVLAGMMPFWMGNDDRASNLFGQGLEIARALHDAPLESRALGGLCRVALRTDVPEGRRLAREALDVSVAAGDEAGRSNALHLLGVGAQIATDLTDARQWMTERLALVRGQGNEFLVASEAANLSMVERQLGNLDEAEQLDREALEIGRRIGDEFTKPFAIAGLAAVAVERGDNDRAAVLIGAAEALMEVHQMAWPPDERPHYELMLDVLPVAMGSDSFERARSIGQTMSAEAAITYALGKDTALPST